MKRAGQRRPGEEDQASDVGAGGAERSTGSSQWHRPAGPTGHKEEGTAPGTRGRQRWQGRRPERSDLALARSC